MRVLLAESACRHGYGAGDYLAVIRNPHVRIRSRRGLRGVYELLGRNDGGDYLHIVIRIGWIGEEKVTIVFHVLRMSDAARRYYLKRVRR